MRTHFWIAAATAMLSLQASQGAAAKPSIGTLYSFCMQSGCADGSSPESALVADAAGNLYGTTVGGGAASKGTIFELKKTQTGYTFQELYQFCPKSGCSDGSFPIGTLLLDTAGNLYGTAYRDGPSGSGTVFELVRHRVGWTLTMLYGFCPTGFGCVDGMNPYSGLTYLGQQSGVPYDGVSPLFGTTYLGGGVEHAGTVFELAFGKNRTAPTLTTIHTFCAQQHCLDGDEPRGGLVMDASGDLFGTTETGGVKNGGVVFELSPQGAAFGYTLLHSFCTLSRCADGQAPAATLAWDAAGNLLGTTVQGGANNMGVVFETSPRQQTTKSLYSFCPKAGCKDGALPESGVAMGPQGILYGMASNGGKANHGLIYSIQGSVEKTVYAFCPKSGCADGAVPMGGVILDSEGNLFGVTASGGARSFGSVFKLTP